MSELPSHIGPYQITGLLGRGGMGVVYRATQREPLVREVALKTIVGGLDAGEILARFEAERAVLARMTHPSIANVYDAGMTDDGRPYFAMEYVDGEELTAYCDARRLDVRDRLRLFVQTCRAVHHAHQKGIIHRDLKPSNVLVATIDGAPLCKLIDFGIAKATEGTDDEHARLTRAEAMIGTPAYMSPEQIGGQDDIDTRTDVYALGVLLYELLSGALPHPPESYRGWAAIAQVLTGHTPAMTQRLAALADTQQTVAAARSTSPADLRRRLAGELEWIVGKAMEHERGRRYDSAASLADDLERHLADEPVLAGPVGAGYRARKFVKRNRVAVAGALAVGLALVGGFVATSINLTRAVAAEASAREEAATAVQVTDYLTELFYAADPGREAGARLTALDLLDRGVEQVDRLDDQPMVQARLLSAMGSAYLGLTFRPEGEAAIRRALEIREEALGPEHPEVAASLIEIANMIENDAAWGEDPERDAEMRGNVDRALQILERDLARGGRDTAAWLNAATFQASLTRMEHGWERAQPMYQALLDRMSDEFGPYHDRAVGARNAMAGSLMNDDRAEAAAELWRFNLDRPGLTSDEEETLLNNLSLAYDRLGRVDESVAAMERVRELWEQRSTPGDPNIEPILYNLATTYKRAGRYEDMLRVNEELSVIIEGAYGETDGRLALYLADVVMSYALLGRSDEALAVLDRVMRITRSALENERLGDDDRGYFALSYVWGMAHYAAGDLAGIGRFADEVPHLPVERAAQFVNNAAWGVEAEFGPDAGLEARRAIRPAIVALARQSGDPGAWRAVKAYYDELGNLLTTRRDGPALVALADEWIETLRPFGREATLQAHRDIASHLFRAWPYGGLNPIEEVRHEAIPYLLRALEMRERDLGRDDTGLVVHLVPLDIAYRHAGQVDEADRYRNRVRALMETAMAARRTEVAESGPIDPQRWNSLCWWGSLGDVADVVMEACEIAVAEADDANRAGNRDSRALARLRTGDVPGALDDLRAYVESRPRGHEQAEIRRSWIEALEAGEDPLTVNALASLVF
jgi:tetratricopeptide (TPR) repeat protein